MGPKERFEAVHQTSGPLPCDEEIHDTSFEHVAAVFDPPNVLVVGCERATKPEAVPRPEFESSSSGTNSVLRLTTLVGTPTA